MIGAWSQPAYALAPEAPPEHVGAWSAPLHIGLFDPAMVNPGVLLTDSGWLAHELIWNEE